MLQHLYLSQRFFHTIVSNYSLLYLFQLDSSIRRSIKSPCTHCFTDFCFHCGVALFSLYELDKFRNYLLLKRILIAKLELFLSHPCLTHFLSNIFVILKHNENSFFKKIYKEKSMWKTQTIFYERNREPSQFMFQKNNFSSTHGMSCSRHLELLEEEQTSPCPIILQSESGFRPSNPSRNWWNLKGKNEYLWLVEKLHPSSSQDPPIETQYSTTGTPDTCLCPCLVRLDLNVLHATSP